MCSAKNSKSVILDTGELAAMKLFGLIFPNSGVFMLNSSEFKYQNAYNSRLQLNPPPPIW